LLIVIFKNLGLIILVVENPFEGLAVGVLGIYYISYDYIYSFYELDLFILEFIDPI